MFFKPKNGTEREELSSLLGHSSTHGGGQSADVQGTAAGLGLASLSSHATLENAATPATGKCRCLRELWGLARGSTTWRGNGTRPSPGTHTTAASSRPGRRPASRRPTAAASLGAREADPRPAGQQQSPGGGRPNALGRDAASPVPPAAGQRRAPRAAAPQRPTSPAPRGPVRRSPCQAVLPTAALDGRQLPPAPPRAAAAARPWPLLHVAAPLPGPAARRPPSRPSCGRAVAGGAEPRPSLWIPGVFPFPLEAAGRTQRQHRPQSHLNFPRGDSGSNMGAAILRYQGDVTWPRGGRAQNPFRQLSGERLGRWQRWVGGASVCTHAPWAAVREPLRCAGPRAREYVSQRALVSRRRADRGAFRGLVVVPGGQGHLNGEMGRYGQNREAPRLMGWGYGFLAGCVNSNHSKLQ